MAKKALGIKVDKAVVPLEFIWPDGSNHNKTKHRLNRSLNSKGTVGRRMFLLCHIGQIVAIADLLSEVPLEGQFTMSLEFGDNGFVTHNSGQITVYGSGAQDVFKRFWIETQRIIQDLKHPQLPAFRFSMTFKQSVTFELPPQPNF